MKHTTPCAAFLFSTFLAPSAMAELRETRHWTCGERACVTFDDRTGLSWLDVGESDGLSYDAVVAGSGGWTGNGWRYATGAEICTLYADYAFAPATCPSPGPSGGEARAGDWNLALGGFLGPSPAAGDPTDFSGRYDDGDPGDGFIGNTQLDYDGVGDQSVNQVNDDQTATSGNAANGSLLVRDDLAGGPCPGASSCPRPVQLDGTEQNRAVTSTFDGVQTFLVESDGFLAGLEFSAFVNGPGLPGLLVEILDATAGVPGAPVLASVALSSADLGPSPQTLDPDTITATFVDLVCERIFVRGGSTLAFRLSSGAQSPFAYGIRSSLSNPYPDGSYFGGGTELPAIDLAFKVFLARQTIDQQNLEGAGQIQAIHSDRTGVQTLVAGIDGILSGLELSVLRPGPIDVPDLVIDILDASGGVPGAPVLGSVNVTPEEVLDGPTLLDADTLTATYVDLSALGIQVESQQPLAIRFSSAVALPRSYGVRVSTFDPYPDGFFGGETTLGSNLDAAFKLFVVPQSLDQEQLDGSEQIQAVHSTNTTAQTFVVDRTGQLTGVELSLLTIGTGLPDIVVDVLDASSGVVGAPVLGSVTVAQDELASSPLGLDGSALTATYVDLACEQIFVQAGALLAFRFSTDAVLPDLYGVRVSLSDPYPDGFYGTLGGLPNNIDAAFKVFVVGLPSAVPTLGPPALGLLVLLLLGLAYHRTRS